ncbi:hypothetical protein D3C81_1889790 [compost metagenome]
MELTSRYTWSNQMRVKISRIQSPSQDYSGFGLFRNTDCCKILAYIFYIRCSDTNQIRLNIVGVFTAQFSGINTRRQINEVMAVCICCYLTNNFALFSIQSLTEFNFKTSNRVVQNIRNSSAKTGQLQ